MNIIRKPAGVILLIIERILCGAMLLFFVFGRWIPLSRELEYWMALIGILYIVNGYGVAQRKKWGWLLTVIEIAVGIAGGIVGVTYMALSLPSDLGRGWFSVLIIAALASFTVLVCMFIAFFHAQSYFKEHEHAWRTEKWNRMLWVSVWCMVLIKLTIVGAVLKNIDALRGIENETQGALTHAIAYCSSLETGTQRDSCFLQIAVAARETGDALPQNFCTHVSLAQPQLKFLCIAYTRQIESCEDFDAERARVLCRALVSGRVDACASLAAEEQKNCISTVSGYLEALQNKKE